MISLFDGAVTIRRDTRPLSLDEETRALYNRAITEPASLTDVQRRRITHRPPAEEEDALCRQACGLSIIERVAKAIAIANNDNGSDDENLILTYSEAHLLTAGVVPGQPGRLLSERARLSEADRDLSHRAAAAAVTEEMKVARETAQEVQRRWRIAQGAAIESLNDDDVRNILFAMPVPWQERVIHSTSTDGSPSISGLVVFYDPERTAEYKSSVEKAVCNGLHYHPMSMDDKAIARFTLYWVEFPALDSNDDNTVKLSALRSKFQTMIANHEFPVGLRSDCFLYMDEEGLRSIKPYLWENWGRNTPAQGGHQAYRTDAICPAGSARSLGRRETMAISVYVRADDAAPGGAILSE
ncbi:conserved hypothetical protein [Talaromyces stipitatus ATCC 10500]|uniref:Uncharacterized protein n=1 Tax=Talaromyces stipitatus (strain ATCC 10500 / CBS 375.48 / QM 6759 / NRRL 1006) TaxID=441959 RepID=B8M085_TALSN|nr:uncharacterized protein TSTA_084130 [Talaromyces stipitatus ATCC 10500]EED21182.1 conserved hypothetical protein [Talaromyces stipitatus ATCC 10500]